MLTINVFFQLVIKTIVFKVLLVLSSPIQEICTLTRLNEFLAYSDKMQ